VCSANSRLITTLKPVNSSYVIKRLVQLSSVYQTMVTLDLGTGYDDLILVE